MIRPIPIPNWLNVNTVSLPIVPPFNPCKDGMFRVAEVIGTKWTL